MSESTPLLNLPFIMAAQAQKHVTHNDALLGLDALVQLSVLSRAFADPPATPLEGDRYLIAASATGDWAGMEGSIGAFQDAVWQFHLPMPGWRAWIADEARFLVYDGTQWRSTIADADLQNLADLGINTTADATNKLSVASDAVLFSHNGTDSQVKVNKATAGDTASHLFQTGFSGRAEFGLTGDDDFHAKVSPDGSTWYEGLKIDKATGRAQFPSGMGVAGSFTPTARFTTPGDFSPTYSYQKGVYVDYGNTVLIWLYLTFSCNAFTTAGGNFYIDGLPYAAVSDTPVTYPLAIARMQYVTLAASVIQSGVAVSGGTTRLYPYVTSSASGGGGFLTTNITASSTNVHFEIAGEYRR